MKSFKQFLSESKVDYSFRVNFSAKPDPKIEELIRHNLGGFKVKAIGDLKSQIVKKSNPLFPDVANPEVYTIDVTCEYPATSEQIRIALTQRGIDRSSTAVENLLHAEDVAAERKTIEDNTSGKPLLMRELENNKVNSADYYGDKYNEKMVKDSVTGVTKMKVKGGSQDAKTTNDLPQGKSEKIGPISGRNKLPKVVSNNG